MPLSFHFEFCGPAVTLYNNILELTRFLKKHISASDIEHWNLIKSLVNCVLNLLCLPIAFLVCLYAAVTLLLKAEIYILKILSYVSASPVGRLICYKVFGVQQVCKEMWF